MDANLERALHAVGDVLDPIGLEAGGRHPDVKAAHEIVKHLIADALGTQGVDGALGEASGLGWGGHERLVLLLGVGCIRGADTRGTGRRSGTADLGISARRVSMFGGSGYTGYRPTGGFGRKIRGGIQQGLSAAPI